MANLSDPDFGRSARRLRVDTLIRLRWLAIAGQTFSIVLVRFGLGFPLQLGWCLAVIAVSAAVNFTLGVSIKRMRQLEDGPATLLLAFDILQLACLLCLTGGVNNPFSLLILAPVVVSAVSLPRMATFSLFLEAACLMLLMTWFHLPLPWAGEPAPQAPPLYQAGVWLAVIIGMGFVCVYAGRVAEEARLLSDALAATELVLAREQHLSQLDGLAAACAHELGTPLSTISLIVKELSRNPQTPPPPDDLELLSQQTQRCRKILSQLSSLQDADSGFLRKMAFGLLLDEICEPHRHFGVAVEVALCGEAPAPQTLRNPGLLYGLGNIVENAVDFARTRVLVTGAWSSQTVVLTIADDGAGFAPEVLRRFGEPYLTTRHDARKAKSEQGAGLGLGLFIAKTLLERSGAQVSIVNAQSSHSGGLVRITWPRSLFEVKEATASLDVSA